MWSWNSLLKCSMTIRLSPGCSLRTVSSAYLVNILLLMFRQYMLYWESSLDEKKPCSIVRPRDRAEEEPCDSRIAFRCWPRVPMFILFCQVDTLKFMSRSRSWTSGLFFSNFMKSCTVQPEVEFWNPSMIFWSSSSFLLKFKWIPFSESLD